MYVCIATSRVRSQATLEYKLDLAGISYTCM